MPRRLPVTFTLAALLLPLAAGCGATDPAQAPRDPAAAGPWQVGVTTFDLQDPAEPSRHFPVEVWYPATPAQGAPGDKVLGMQTESVRDAPADRRGAPFPVVVFSHGNTGIRQQSVYLTQHLASHGYLVVAPDHLHNTMLDYDRDLVAQVMRERPRDVSLALDAVLRRSTTATDPLAGLADPTRIGAAGHSFGGYTVLLLAGARMDLPAWRAQCTATPDPLVCAGTDGTITAADVDSFADARIGATVALAPGGIVAFGPAGLGALRGPVQVQAGPLDGVTPLATEVEPIYQGLPPPKQLAVIREAAHFSFTDICPLYELMGGAGGPLDHLTTEGCGANTIPIAEAHAASRTLATAFFDLHLRAIADPHGYLDPARGVANATLQ